MYRYTVTVSTGKLTIYHFNNLMDQEPIRIHQNIHCLYNNEKCNLGTLPFVNKADPNLVLNQWTFKKYTTMPKEVY